MPLPLPGPESDLPATELAERTKMVRIATVRGTVTKFRKAIASPQRSQLLAGLDILVNPPEINVCFFVIPKTNYSRPRRDTMAGIDWSGGVRSRTAVVIGYLTEQNVFRVCRCDLIPPSEEPDRILRCVVERCPRFNIVRIAADGAGNRHTYNRLLLKKLKHDRHVRDLLFNDSILLREQPGWVTFTLDGQYTYSSTEDVIDVATRKVITGLTGEPGQQVHSEKMLEIDIAGGRAVRNGDQFELGRVRVAASR